MSNMVSSISFSHIFQVTSFNMSLVARFDCLLSLSDATKYKTNPFCCPIVQGAKASLTKVVIPSIFCQLKHFKPGQIT
jgi:hypothetical protein